MATDTALTRVLCIGDSRLRHLQPLLNNNRRNIYFNCYVFPGATLGYLTFQLRLLLQSGDSNYAYVVMMGGICDLTILSRSPTKQLVPAYPTASSMAENFERIFALARESISLFTRIPTVFTPLVGVHLSRYSNGDELVFQYQPVIDQSIPLINNIIRSVNSQCGLLTPNVAHSIHHCHGKRGSYRTRYCRLFDGCHPDFETQQRWVQEILKSITNMVYTWP